MPLFIVTCLLLSLFFVVVVFSLLPSFLCTLFSLHVSDTSSIWFYFYWFWHATTTTTSRPPYQRFSLHRAYTIGFYYLLFAFACPPHLTLPTCRDALTCTQYKQTVKRKDGKESSGKKRKPPNSQPVHCISSYERIHRAVNISRTRSGEVELSTCTWNTGWRTRASMHARTSAHDFRFPLSRAGKTFPRNPLKKCEM